MVNRPILAPLLKVQALQCQRDGRPVLRQLGFQLGEGSVTGLIGPNGAGKSSLLDVLSGHLLPDSGSVRLGDQELLGLPPYRFVELGIARTGEDPLVFPGLRVIDNVLIGRDRRHAYGWWDVFTGSARMRLDESAAHAEARRLLDLLGLGAQAGLRAGELGHAARRRLEIARALASEPQILLLDEPVAGMNPREAADLLACLRTLRSAGYSMLITEHAMGFVMELCEQVMVLNAGTLVAQGDPEELRGNRRVVEAFLGREVSTG